MSDKLFFDTNILIYAVANDTDRTPAALDLLSRGGTISVQVINEFTNTARRKLKRPWDEVVAALDSLRTICNECMSITEQTHHLAIDLSRHHSFSLYDAVIVASALEANCTLLVTEDMQDGRVVNDRVKIHNPFRRSSPS